MILTKFLVLCGLAASAAAATSPNPAFCCGGWGQPACTAANACGKINIVFSGLVVDDPEVIAAGFDPAQVAAAMMQDRANIVRAGYNIKVILVGSRNPNAIANISQEIRKGPRFDASGVGYGVRGSRSPNVTFLFTDLIKLYRSQLPYAPILFNFSPNSTIVAIQREFPLPPGVNCTNNPGKDLGTANYP